MTPEERAKVILGGKCSCIDAYKDRGLVDHMCVWCNHKDDAVEQIRQAIAEEREACAKVVEDYYLCGGAVRQTGTTAAKAIVEKILARTE